MFFKKFQHRVFDYTPQFYDPEKDEELRRKRKLKFRTHLKVRRKKVINPFVLLLIFLFVLYLYLKLQNIIK